jgi:hypothetical protein
MTSKANPLEIVRKSAEACAELIPSKSGKKVSKTIQFIFVNGNQIIM